MLAHLLDTVSKLKPNSIHIVVGHGKEQIKSDPLFSTSNINWVEQEQQNGTGHAVLQAIPHIENHSRVLILNGDVPMISLTTLQRICDSQNRFNLLTVNMENPVGMGRIIRDNSNNVLRIVEEKDASAEQKDIKEINTNCMCIDTDLLSKWLPQIGDNNAQGEIYLTDCIERAVSDDVLVNTLNPDNDWETFGVNNKVDLSKLERIYQKNRALELMSKGVTLMDPTRFDLRGTCHFGNDCTVDINVILQGDVKIGDTVSIGANCIIRNSCIASGCNIEPNSLIDNAIIGENCNVGPFARIRPDTVLENNVRIGNFVEVKKSHVQTASKINHLSYVGDSEIGKDVNIGAGVITCNYDGANKYKTIIGNNVFVGSDSQLVAPVTIADGATIGAGSTITDDVDEKSLAVSRGRQRAIPNWKRPKKNKP